MKLLPDNAISMRYLQARRLYLLSLLVVSGFTILYLCSSSKFTATAFRKISNADHLGDVQNRTLGFQKIYVINLPTRPDRRLAMSLSAAATNLTIEHVDGVTGEVDVKTLPPGGLQANLSSASLNSWRAHVNVLQRIVESNVASALILEDDVDWDVRIKLQMQTFAEASRLLIQPLPGSSSEFLDPTYQAVTRNEQPSEFTIGRNNTSLPSGSPYGDLDRWDLLWLGHCGSRFPYASDRNVPIGRVVIRNDTTVPGIQYLDMGVGDSQLFRYPSHTRVVSRARVNSCSLAYGLSQQGARRMLYELGMHKLDAPADILYRSVCDGVQGRDLATCLSVQPQLFQHHQPVGPRSSQSDISAGGRKYSGYQQQAVTTNIRWSTRLNLPKLVNGETDFLDQFPDTKSLS